MNERPLPFSKSGISLKGLMELVCIKRVNGGGVTSLKFHVVVDDICVFLCKGSPIMYSLWSVELREYELV